MSELNNLSQNQNQAENHSDEGQLVVFRLFEEEFGVEIGKVKEIVRLPDIIPIPRSPDYVSGICNLRGNVLPVIDTRTRFSMKQQEATDHTRLLVLDSGGSQTSLIVDSVREVMRMSYSHVEPPPAVCKGVDREFLSGIVKVDNGNRLILMLNLNEVLSVDMDGSGVKDETSGTGESKNTKLKEDKATEEQQLVSFRVAGDEYGFDIAKVREILRLSDITSVPNVPSYVKGLFTIRNHLLPILDLREMLGLPTLISDRHEVIDKAVKEHSEWVENLQHVLNAGTHFTGILNAKETSFGIWLESYKTSSIELEAIVKRLKKARANLYGAGSRVLDMRTEDKISAISLFNEKIPPILSIILDILSQFKDSVSRHILEDQRALVVESDTMTIGYLVDWVDEVIRVPHSVIDETPFIASSDRKELKAVAKLEKGDRLIMIMDESALVSRETTRLLSDMKSRAGDKGDAKKTLAQQSIDEVQLVTFSINTEEYGIRIMQVQEINRISEITGVPRSPYFIDGMTNLRGNVIPVISIRKLFGLKDKPVDDRTRIIIVDLGGNKTGLRVDQVNEVLRLERRDIEKTPSAVTLGGANLYMQGVCKINNGKRIVILLNVEKILNEEELRHLGKITESSEPKESIASEDSPADEKVSAFDFAQADEEIKPEQKKRLEIAE